MDFRIKDKINERDRAEVFHGLLQYNLARIEEKNPQQFESSNIKNLRRLEKSCPQVSITINSILYTGCTCLLYHLQYCAFQVLRFGRSQQNRVVLGLGPVFHNPDTSSGVGGGVIQNVHEQFGVNML